ncbi:dynamin family protein [Paenibacillus campi]|uniref:dynamin family protein n=1 Tax=Paenibacillus campi TaxID=3106031 RepID=UPI002AFEE8D1|nr:dynamin family protein [Paenibacillus sp. SGZ-1009]
MQAITTENEQSFELVLERLEAELRQQGNTAAARKAGELRDKYRSQELVLAFCGHFSAGKSSLMNWLCGHQVLPTSPVPTTANIASIRCGEPHVIVHTHDGGTLQIGLHELEAYCKNGGDYEAVELWDDIPLLGEHGVLLDTPGVDSTDDAHEAATYSALHRADVVFYVMDYNHVQSETNLSFARTLYERGKPLYLIVNQIDKHEEEELPFADYRRGVEQAFARRGIQPAGVLYVSRMAPNHRYGRLEQLRELIAELLHDYQPLLRYSLSQAAWELAEEHRKWLREQLGDVDDREQDGVDDDEFDHMSFDLEADNPQSEGDDEHVSSAHSDELSPSAQQQLEQLREQAQALGKQLTVLKDQWAWEIGRLVEQANITPADVRDLAQQYLEGERPGFKKGLFASRDKTMQERIRRKQQFLQAFREQVTANLDVHVRALLRGWSMEYELWNEAQESELTASLPQISEHDIAAGAGSDMAISGEYVLNYTRALREQTAARYRRTALEASDRLIAQLQPSIEAQQTQLHGQIAIAESRLQRLTATLEREQQQQRQDEAVRQLLPTRETGVPEWLPKIERIGMDEAAVQLGRNESNSSVPNDANRSSISAAAIARSAAAVQPQSSAYQNAATAEQDGIIAASVNQGMKTQQSAEVDCAADGAYTVDADAFNAMTAADKTIPDSDAASDVAAAQQREQRAALAHDQTAALVAAAPSAASDPNVHAQTTAADPSVIEADPSDISAPPADRRTRLLATAEQLRKAAGWIDGIAGLTSQGAELRRRAAVMENGKFTLALFGAFSAGKSSFANALLGASVLPVSPHPMTAAITQIMSSEPERPHGTAVIYMKSAQELQEDISGALRLLGLPDRSLDQDWSRAVHNLSPARIHPSARAHYNFVVAAAAGWEAARHKLGQDLIVDMQQFRGYVSEEQQSCFVRSIDLYYDCPLTAQGMVLVDTPGADSVNARHTGVTFEYMKTADALVFVTYYNHAFTAGDRQLLEQLGRVKGSLALDNMFFIVNAADLASSEQEKQQVVQRIEQELNGAGIREPHIYALSSRRALQGQDEGFAAFRRHFMSFADDTLAGLAIHAAHEELGRIRDIVYSWQEAAERGEQYRAERIVQLQQEKETASRTIDALAEADPDRRVQEESTELLFHVRQRLKLKTLDWIPEIFNPAQLNQESADLKADFAACGRELQRRLGIELEQEVLATTLRMEKAARRLIADRMQTYGREAEKQAPGLRFSTVEPEDWKTPDISALLSSKPLDWKTFWPLFRNPRQFFEQGGRDKLRQQLTAELDGMVGRALDEQRDGLAHYYIEGLNIRLQQTAAELKRRIAEWAQGTEASLQMADGPEHWAQLGELLYSLQPIAMTEALER